jgi:hypothetical protein
LLSSAADLDRGEARGMDNDTEDGAAAVNHTFASQAKFGDRLREREEREHAAGLPFLKAIAVVAVKVRGGARAAIVDL